MRELKFRAFDTVSNKMLYCDELRMGKDQRWSMGNIINGIHFSDTDNLNGELMQYTGLSDKNGTEIYEGDIIERNESKSFVTYCLGQFRMNGYCGGGGLSVLETTQAHLGYGDGVVIGNIYEHKELLNS